MQIKFTSFLHKFLPLIIFDLYSEFTMKTISVSTAYTHNNSMDVDNFTYGILKKVKNIESAAGKYTREVLKETPLPSFWNVLSGPIE